jgi:hypothetical protein
MWRPPRGAETNPLRVATSRTARVATNDNDNEKANKIKKRSGKIRIPFCLQLLAPQTVRATSKL